MKWTVSLPRVVAEDDRCSTQVEAESIEEAITKAAVVFRGKGTGNHGVPLVGQVYLVHARVEVTHRPALPLRSV